MYEIKVELFVLNHDWWLWWVGEDWPTFTGALGRWPALPPTLQSPVVVLPMRARTKPKTVEPSAKAKMAQSGPVNPETQATVVWLLLRSSICAQKSNL